MDGADPEKCRERIKCKTFARRVVKHLLQTMDPRRNSGSRGLLQAEEPSKHIEQEALYCRRGCTVTPSRRVVLLVWPKNFPVVRQRMGDASVLSGLTDSNHDSIRHRGIPVSLRWSV